MATRVGFRIATYDIRYGDRCPFRVAKLALGLFQALRLTIELMRLESGSEPRFRRIAVESDPPENAIPGGRTWIPVREVCSRTKWQRGGAPGSKEPLESTLANLTHRLSR